jgi:hypothetical protein
MIHVKRSSTVLKSDPVVSETACSPPAADKIPGDLDASCESPTKKQRKTHDSLTPSPQREDVLSDTDCGSPTEEQRKRYERLAPRFEREDMLSDKALESLERRMFDEFKNLVQIEVPLDTVFERSNNRLENMAVGAMASMALLQKCYRQKDQEGLEPHRVFTKRAKEMLDKEWEHVREMIIAWLKRGVQCRWCNDYHLKEEFEPLVKDLEAYLELIDPNTVDQATLDGIQEKACIAGEDYLLKVPGTRCQGVRKIWRLKTTAEQISRDRADSAVDLASKSGMVFKKAVAMQRRVEKKIDR